MAASFDWITEAAMDIVKAQTHACGNSLNDVTIRHLIAERCPLKPDTAYVEVYRLTPNEKRMLSIAAAGASSETAALLGMIERLTGHHIVPADERIGGTGGRGQRQ